ncbi:hypothetical protein ACOSRT_004571 [Providencia stuartii]|nr:hypothetical protein [Providencia stuartii]
MHRLLNGLILAKKSEQSFSATLDFFEVRQGIWLILVILHKQFMHQPSKKRALNALVFRLQHDKIDANKLERIIQRLSNNHDNPKRLMLLQDYLNRLAEQKRR